MANPFIGNDSKSNKRKTCKGKLAGSLLANNATVEQIDNSGNEFHWPSKQLQLTKRVDMDVIFQLKMV